MGDAGVAEKRGLAAFQGLPSDVGVLGTAPQFLTEGERAKSELERIEAAQPDAAEIVTKMSDYRTQIASFRQKVGEFSKLVKRFFPEDPPPFNLRLGILRKKSDDPAGQRSIERPGTGLAKRSAGDYRPEANRRNTPGLLRRRGHTVRRQRHGRPDEERNAGDRARRRSAGQGDQCELRIRCKAAEEAVRKAMGQARVEEASQLLSQAEAAGLRHEGAAPRTDPGRLHGGVDGGARGDRGGDGCMKPKRW